MESAVLVPNQICKHTHAARDGLVHTLHRREATILNIPDGYPYMLDILEHEPYSLQSKRGELCSGVIFVPVSMVRMFQFQSWRTLAHCAFPVVGPCKVHP